MWSKIPDFCKITLYLFSSFTFSIGGFVAIAVCGVEGGCASIDVGEVVPVAAGIMLFSLVLALVIAIILRYKERNRL